ncbi:MAG: hypothetical protein ACREP6_11620 [Candidatus Binataceae bacterium]
MSGVSLDEIAIEATLILCRLNIEVGQLAAFSPGDEFETDLVGAPRIAAELVAGNQVLMLGVIEVNDGLPFFQVTETVSEQPLPAVRWRLRNGDDD